MIFLVLAAVAAAAILLRVRSRVGDLPERIAVAAAHRLPLDRRPWGQALVAELAAIPAVGQRWRFAAAVLRITAFPPVRKPARVRATAVVGGLLTLAATLAADRVVPTLSVFVASLGLLTSGYATAAACRRPRLPTSRAQLAAAAIAVAGVLAAVSAVVAIAATHPAATRDQTHVFSLILAAALGGYLIAGLSAAPSNAAAPATVWGAVAASLAVAVSTVLLPAEAISSPISPMIAAATLATTLGVGAVTGSRVAATRAGLLAAVLSTPIHFAAGLVVAQYIHPAVLINAYDIAAYPHSGYPDVASYLLSDTLGGNIVSLAVTPLAMPAIAVVAAAVAPRLRRG